MGRKKIYLVTTGEYSYYSVRRVFAKKSDAKAYVKAYDAAVGSGVARVETMPLDGRVLPSVKWTAWGETDNDSVWSESEVLDFEDPPTGEPVVRITPRKRVNFTNYIVSWLVTVEHADKRVAEATVKRVTAELRAKAEHNKEEARESEDERVRAWARGALGA